MYNTVPQTGERERVSPWASISSAPPNPGCTDQRLIDNLTHNTNVSKCAKELPGFCRLASSAAQWTRFPTFVKVAGRFSAAVF